MVTRVLASALQVGLNLESLTVEPVSRLTLALYAGGSGDHNPVHVDLDAAHDAGLEDVIAHGMLSMAYLARLVTTYVPHTAVRSLSVRFSAMTHVGDKLTCRAEVVEVIREGDENRVRLALSVTDQVDSVKLIGEATAVAAAPVEISSSMPGSPARAPSTEAPSSQSSKPTQETTRPSIAGKDPR
jgi:acyl dehydratase